MLLETMTYEEVQAALADGRCDVIVPCGAVEQHGPHLPLDVDAVHADRLAVELAQRLGTALVAPTIRAMLPRQTPRRSMKARKANHNP